MLVGENLSSCPSRQVEMKRQHESGHGMDLYCSHHLKRFKYIALFEFYQVRPANYNAHVKPKNKRNRNQVSKPLAVDWDLLKLCLIGKWLWQENNRTWCCERCLPWPPPPRAVCRWGTRSRTGLSTPQGFARPACRYFHSNGTAASRTLLAHAQWQPADYEEWRKFHR